MPVIPTHFGAYDAGTPLMKPVGDAPDPGMSVGELAAHIGRLNDEDAVRNLVHAYGYYLDRRMWGDVVDLFTVDAAIRFDDEVFHGSEGARRAHEARGPEGLGWGEAAEHPLFDVTVEIADDGTARARGIQLGILADVRTGTACWEFATVRARLVAGTGGLWRIAGLDVDVLPGRLPRGMGRRRHPGSTTGPHPGDRAARAVTAADRRRRGRRDGSGCRGHR
ncbi:nuclear transport factor 2 family protein [Microbacterium elymi]|uniref:Nuclear transport factor 2 family protein n=1 Tax=Microbacterium elymi TaxID=2909587 RepID=A0ABY5NMN7_9MICO|nr:nuclear transport factor 2 family protein [Microbacterium elymi]UUT36453.1 nuclear transport factor 2 family protein [Microbacterium elymi]